MAEDAEKVARSSAEVMLGRDAASAGLGIELEDVGPGHATLTMRVRDDMVNGFGLCHGGLLASLADSAFAVACNSYGEVTVAAGFDITFLESGRAGDLLRAHAVERARRGRSGLYDVTVTRAADNVVLAEFRGRSRSLGKPVV
ncbi:hydroxyphenylacetyl-CoA thioesterase PaaI [Actinoplanes sp. TRM 88003]|uniref:Hydroxyphenylacetyl-CoA thioesterase PaaI n=1 Tax=Paractinoplanes aksuensis TaxID=2939490 RepID=A0ABT1DI03_9ACTN|nr:hydroxyphenylacetyl-CoA thioesterase PaaI [Actinoplanes aksuensis]MCO8270459.1 hydroxyphenylacetyl-CoA thioesterase PaaI [Actinoplanes aksuensis]